MTFDQGSVEALAVGTEAILAPRATTGNPSSSATSVAPGVTTTTSSVTTLNQSSSITSSAPEVATTSLVTTLDTTTSTATRPTSSVSRITRSTASYVASNPSSLLLSSTVQAIASSSTAASSRTKRKRRQQSEDEGEEEGDKCEAFICQAKGKEVRTRSWIFCETCKKWFHFDCVGISKAPPGDYNCGCNKRQINRLQVFYNLRLFKSDILLPLAALFSLACVIRDVMNDCQYLQLITLESICSCLAWYYGRLNHIKSKKFAFFLTYVEM